MDVSIAERVPGVYDVSGDFTVRASSRTVWEVLTDYGDIGRFVSSVVSSEVNGRAAGRIFVRQRMRARVLFFSREVELRLIVSEDPMRRIRFRDRGREDFRRYEGEWRLDETGRGVRVRYSLEAEPALGAPEFLERPVLRGSVESLLEEVRDEILRRAAREPPSLRPAR